MLFAADWPVHVSQQPKLCFSHRHLPVRGGSVKVRTNRRDKTRTKLLLSAFGNIYPPFIVVPTQKENNREYELAHPRQERATKTDPVINAFLNDKVRVP